MTPDTLLAGSARLVVVLHAVAAMVLLGASTHHAIVALGYLRGTFRVRLGRIYAATVAIAYGATFGLGLLAYPTFRYHVRALYLDRAEPWASNLFDAKENVAALGLPLALAAFVLSRTLAPKTDRAHAIAYAAFVWLTAAIAWFAVISGLLVTLAKGV